jgi:hypothetical protein
LLGISVVAVLEDLEPAIASSYALLVSAEHEKMSRLTCVLNGRGNLLQVNGARALVSRLKTLLGGVRRPGADLECECCAV